MASLKIPKMDMIKPPAFLKMEKVSPMEGGVLFVFLVYLLFPLQTPEFVSSSVDSPIGYIVMFLVIVALFLYSHPLIAVLSLLVGYELLRRSAEVATRVPILKYTPSEVKRADEMKEMNPVNTASLEEDIVAKMAPIGRSDPLVYSSSSFSPVVERVEGASRF